MKRLKQKEIILNLLVTLSIGILGFLSNKVFIKYIGTEVLGVMKLFSQMVAYLSIAEMGIGASSSYSLYKPLNEKNYEKVSEIVSTMIWFYKIVGIIILFIGRVVTIFLPWISPNNNIGKEIYILDFICFKYFIKILLYKVFNTIYSESRILLFKKSRRNNKNFFSNFENFIDYIFKIISYIYFNDDFRKSFNLVYF